MFDPRDIHRMDRLRRGLFSRKNPFAAQQGARADISKSPDGTTSEPVVSPAWQPLPPEKQPRIRLEAESFFKKILIGSVLFFVLSGAIVTFVLLGGFNILSVHNVDIALAGPVSIPGGEQFNLDVTIFNRNNTDFTTGTVTIEYPQGARDPKNPAQTVTREKKDIGPLVSGKSTTVQTSALLYGEENSVQTINVIFEYTTSSTKTPIVKEKVYQVALSAAPITLRVETLKETNAGQKVPITISIESNSNTDLSNVLVTTEYPFGFEFQSAVPAALADNRTWLFPTLSPGEKKKITIDGKFQGQDGEERVIRFMVGSQSTESATTIDTTYASVVQSIAIRKPFIGISMSVNGDSRPDYALPGAGGGGISIDWKNNVPARIADLEITAKIIGNVLDRSRIVPRSGFYRSIDNTIIWNKQNDPRLALVDPGDNGDVSFSFETISENQLFSGQYLSPSVQIEISVSGKRLSESQVPEEVTSSITRTVKVSTQPRIAADAYYSSGPIRNTGPVPPRVEVLTTFTIAWNVSNPLNNLTGASVVATLPQNVQWKNQSSPTTEVVQYIADTRQVVWQVGQVRAGTGIGGAPARQLLFQVELLPSANQVGQILPLTGRIELEATDAFTNSSLSATTDSMMTSDIDDTPNTSSMTVKN